MDLAQVYKELAPLRKPDPRIYFVDAGLSAAIGWASFAVALAPIAIGWRVLAFVVSAFALFRALAFIHELVHQREMTHFRVFWHVVAGIPLLLPLLLYLPIHHDHHNVRTYGTAADGEYEHFKGRLAPMVTKLFLINLLLPLALVVRFGVLTPLSLVFPVVSREVIPRFIHLAMRIPFKAPLLSESFRAESRRYEWACTGFVALLALACLSGLAKIAAMWAAIVIVIATLNTTRTLFSTHLYVQRREGRDLYEQLQDSINVEGYGLFTQLLCPVGLQYHALHHLAPQLPYHALPKAHAHLTQTLPQDSHYRRSTVANAWQGWRKLRNT